MTASSRPGHRSSRRSFLAGLVVAAGASACESASRVARSASSATAPAPPSPSDVTSAPAAPPTRSASTSPPPPSTSGAAPRGDLVHGPRDVPAVALTFHGAGDPALTRRVLALAREAGAGLTVLAVGSWLAENPALARAVLNGGHELGNHTWHHWPMRRLPAPVAREEIQRAADLLARLTGDRGRWFRPSGTPRSTRTIRAAALESGYARCLAYDVDPRDYTDPGPATVARRLLGGARPGSIVSLHLGHPGTVDALPVVLEGLAGKGLRPVTVTQLVAGA